MHEFITNFWYLILAALAFAGTVLKLFGQIRSLRSDLSQSKQDYAEEYAQKVLKDERTDRRIADIESWREVVNSRDASSLDMYDKLLNSISELSKENAIQHAALKEYVHDEIGKLDKKGSDRSDKLHSRIDRIIENSNYGQNQS